MVALAPKVGCVEIGQLEMRRSAILAGMIDGASQVLEMFGSEMGLDSNARAAVLDGLFPKAAANGRMEYFGDTVSLLSHGKSICDDV
jgi:hypothetical protein